MARAASRRTTSTLLMALSLSNSSYAYGGTRGGAHALSCTSLSAKEPLIMGIFSGKGPQQRCALRILVCNMTCKDSGSKMTAKEPLIVGFVVEIYV